MIGGDMEVLDDYHECSTEVMSAIDQRGGLLAM
jgi:hypothetical protein